MITRLLKWALMGKKLVGHGAKRVGSIINKGRHSGSTVYSELLVDRVCEQLAQGTSLMEICRQEGMPDRATIMGWAVYPDEELRPGFAAKFVRSRQIGWMLMAEDVIDIADDTSKDTVVKMVRGREMIVPNLENVARDRLRVDTRKWILSKTLPRIFGDSIKVEHTVDATLVDRLAAARGRLELLQNRTMGLIEGRAEQIIDNNNNEDGVDS